MNKNAAKLIAETASLRTPGDWLRWAEKAYARHDIVTAQVADNAHDEALYLILRTLGLSLDSKPKVMKRPVSPLQAKALQEVFVRRILERVPAGYLTQEAWLGPYRFFCDERVLIPRSYFLELIPTLAEHLPPGTPVREVVDVCTGSACLAILLAHEFPEARVDGVDLSPEALEVAKINVRDHGVGDRLTLWQSDVFDAVPVRQYDILLSNPPYEPSDLCDDLPPEFEHEPRLALDGGADGLVIIRKLLRQAVERLQPHGIVVLEVGELREAMERTWPKLRMEWLETFDGSDCCCLIHARDLARGL
ncbi:50S ribosomal protein L3 N(5)-glutamine methyltransferase [Actomonas aquatica]|uniref:50S ribosomal protein L3 N(5)-glutamine methyltransferase n=1 Tax=Actomonas aquatica TaxID=2866162 RepID=A0ABZ1C7I4_9BACT|nr:50S ribosomal protein L3 N(5)-glutamine methyltransferase [Opitutus sp. WL0086]WRQ86484.1 50S ribosomal protein L3 N(5)-glutamine methyltransferase [Opitutus sp. WL0086]